MVQLVECLLAKEKVVGSSPIARSLPPETAVFFTGDVAKWQGKGLQNPYSWVRISPSPLHIRAEQARFFI